MTTDKEVPEEPLLRGRSKHRSISRKPARRCLSERLSNFLESCLSPTASGTGQPEVEAGGWPVRAAAVRIRVR